MEGLGGFWSQSHEPVDVMRWAPPLRFGTTPSSVTLGLFNESNSTS